MHVSPIMADPFVQPSFFASYSPPCTRPSLVCDILLRTSLAIADAGQNTRQGDTCTWPNRKANRYQFRHRGTTAEKHASKATPAHGLDPSKNQTTEQLNNWKGSYLPSLVACVSWHVISTEHQDTNGASVLARQAQLEVLEAEPYQSATRSSLARHSSVSDSPEYSRLPWLSPPPYPSRRPDIHPTLSDYIRLTD